MDSSVKSVGIEGMVYIYIYTIYRYDIVIVGVLKGLGNVVRMSEKSLH